jgi:hypothetical protein
MIKIGVVDGVDVFVTGDNSHQELNDLLGEAIRKEIAKVSVKPISVCLSRFNMALEYIPNAFDTTLEPDPVHGAVVKLRRVIGLGDPTDLTKWTPKK